MIGVIDYQLNNLKSLTSALKRAELEYKIIENPQNLSDFERIILPGVGAFPAGMRELRSKGWDTAITESAKAGVKILGICLGMQLLFESSQEIVAEEGLGLVRGDVIPFPVNSNLPVPHMGWNDFRRLAPHEIFENINDGIDFYFVHSFFVNPTDSSDVLAETDYGVFFPSIILKKNILGVQFHPEKSYPAGIQLLKNFSKWT
jgi:glutamine amidotransferase